MAQAPAPPVGGVDDHAFLADADAGGSGVAGHAEERFLGAEVEVGHRPDGSRGRGRATGHGRDRDGSAARTQGEPQ